MNTNEVAAEVPNQMATGLDQDVTTKRAQEVE